MRSDAPVVDDGDRQACTAPADADADGHARTDSTDADGHAGTDPPAGDPDRRAPADPADEDDDRWTRLGSSIAGSRADPGRYAGIELPDLDPGIRLLSTDDGTTGALGSLVVDHLLRTPGPAPWVDAHGRARTRRLAALAPSGRMLDRIRVARGFTAFQHLALVETLGERPGTGDDPDADDGTRGPALVVVPALDAPYRADDLLAGEGREMLLRALAVLAGIARRHDCPVLVTRTREDDLTDPVAAAARERIRCAATPAGPRFVADGFETLVYPRSGGVQTTLAFWERVLRARAPDPEGGADPSPAPCSADSSPGPRSAALSPVIPAPDPGGSAPPPIPPRTPPRIPEERPREVTADGPH